VTADLRLIVHAAEREAHEGAAGPPSPIDLAERGLPDASRADQAQIGPVSLVAACWTAGIRRSLLDLVETVMIIVEHSWASLRSF